jgi:hypothetical protein
MLRQEQNELLTRTGPGTPMGRLFRSSWTPVLLAEELPANDCPPVRVKARSLVGRIIRKRCLNQHSCTVASLQSMAPIRSDFATVGCT